MLRQRAHYVILISVKGAKATFDICADSYYIERQSYYF